MAGKPGDEMTDQTNQTTALLLARAHRRFESPAEGYGPMNDMEAEGQTKDLVLEYELDAPPEKVVKSFALTAPLMRSTPPVIWPSVRPTFLSASKEMPLAFASLIGSAVGTLAIK